MPLTELIRTALVFYTAICQSAIQGGSVSLSSRFNSKAYEFGNRNNQSLLQNDRRREIERKIIRARMKVKIARKHGSAELRTILT